MKLSQEDFERIIKSNRIRYEFVYDKDARLFLCGDDKSALPAIEVGGISYITYLTVRGKTRPMVPRMILSMVGSSKELNPPEECVAPWVYRTGVASYFGKPLEVLAAYCEIGEGKISMWDAAMLQDGDLGRFMNDSFFEDLDSFAKLEVAPLPKSVQLLISG
ncbi:MAG: hypothetical protein ABIB47_03405 [Candidatus Woesearchaeota archaeon]